MARSSVVYVILLAFVFGFGAAQFPSQAPAHPTISHAPRHSVYPPAHAPSPITTPPAAAPSTVVHSPPTKSPVLAIPHSPISMPPSDAPAPAKNAATFNIFSTAKSVAVGVFAAVFII